MYHKCHLSNIEHYDTARDKKLIGKLFIVLEIEFYLYRNNQKRLKKIESIMTSCKTKFASYQ